MRLLRPLFATVSLLTTSVASTAARAERISLVESTYVERGSVGLTYRSTPVPGGSAPVLAAEWSWQAHPRLSFGLLLGSSIGAVAVEDPGPSTTKKDASLVQATLNAEWIAYDWHFLTFTANAEAGSVYVGYRGDFTGTSDQWQSDQAGLVGLGGTAYVHVSQETDLGLAVTYQATRGMQLDGLSDGGMAGATAGLKLRRWF